LNLDEDPDGLRRERIGVEQIQFEGIFSPSICIVFLGAVIAFGMAYVT
jgi:hypothetical protein